MKKLIVLLLLSICSISFAGSRVIPANWQVVTFKVWNPATDGNPIPKSPSDVPEVYMDGYSLYLYDTNDFFTLAIIEDENNQIYTASITAGTSIVTLPSTLSGEYQLRLIPNDSNIYFYGYVMF